MKAQLMSASDKSWQAESDVRTLVEAQVIRNDPKRFKAAQKKAKEQAEAIEMALSTEGDEHKAGEKGD